MRSIWDEHVGLNFQINKIPLIEHFIQEVQPEFLMGHLTNFFGQNITKTE
jgi:hypothetical protein